MNYSVKINWICMLEVEVPTYDLDEAESWALDLVKTKPSPIEWLHENVKNFVQSDFLVSIGQNWIKKTRQKTSKVLLRWIFLFDGNVSARNNDDASMVAYDNLMIGQASGFEEFLKTSLDPWFIILNEPIIRVHPQDEH